MALSPDEKKIYLNPDTTAGEADGAMYFPVKYLTGLDNTTSATVNLYFRNPNNTTSTRVIILITTGFIKEFYTQFVNEINFGENAVITLFVRNLSVSTTQGGSDFVYVNAFAGAIVTAIENLKIASDLDVAELITIGSSAEIGPHILMLNDENSLRVGISNGINALLTGSTDGDVVINSIGDHNVLIGQNDAIALKIDTNGAVALATDLAVAHGGTGASTLTADGVLFGNGTSAISAVDLSTNGNIIVGGSTPAAVTGANLAGAGLAATTGNGTLVLAVETLNQDTTGTAAGLSATLVVGSGGTGLTTVAANAILTGNGTSALTAEANLAFASNRLTIGNGGEDIQPYLRFLNDENTLELGIANAADDFVTGSADGDVVLNSFGDHNVIIGQNDVPALTVDTNGDSNFNRRFTVTGDTDGTYEGDVVYFGGTTSMTVGTIYHYKSDGTWEAANANAVATSDGLLGVALGAASDTNGMLLRGMVTLDHDPGAVGDVLFLSNTAGDASATAPSDNNDIVRVIGYCLHASNGQIWFNPDNTFVEVTA